MGVPHLAHELGLVADVAIKSAARLPEARHAVLSQDLLQDRCTEISPSPDHPPEVEARPHPFIGGILKDLRCIPIAINGTADHLHVLTIYPSDLAHADMLRHIKKRSSEWIHNTFDGLRTFAWQEGYGGFTVSKSAMDKVAEYIRQQKEHHAKCDSLVEFKELLRLHEIGYDPKYLE